MSLEPIFSYRGARISCDNLSQSPHSSFLFPFTTFYFVSMNEQKISILKYLMNYIRECACACNDQKIFIFGVFEVLESVWFQQRESDSASPSANVWQGLWRLTTSVSIATSHTYFFHSLSLQAIATPSGSCFISSFGR